MLKNSTASYCCLTVAMMTLVEVACINLTEAGMPADWAVKSISPAPFEQGTVTLLVGAVLFEKIGQTKS